MISKSSAASSPAGAACGAGKGWLGLLLRCAVTILLVGGYYWFQEPLSEYAVGLYTHATGNALDSTTRLPRILGVTLVLMGIMAIWWQLLKTDPRFQAPLLITTILAVGDAAFNILENPTAPSWLRDLTGGQVTSYSPTFVAI